jgi:hypothetical protein
MSALTPRQVRQQRIAERQARLSQLAREIAPMANKSLDDNDVRTILAAIVRRWSTTVPVRYESQGARGTGQSHVEHVAPVRVIVDRMIRTPRAAGRLLRTCVVLARVSADEHRAIGTMLGTHAELYAEMKQCSLGELVTHGWKRYECQGLLVRDGDGRVPSV